MTNGQIHVCALIDLPDVVARTRPSHLVSAIGPESMPRTPPHVSPELHLKLMFNDIVQPRDGLVHPTEDHISELLAFARSWDRSGPLVVHCWAGISRSTAAAYITLCAHNAPGHEAVIAAALRAASPTATPNPLMIAHADRLLDRGGRMVTAIETIGIGDMAMAGLPFSLPGQF